MEVRGHIQTAKLLLAHTLTVWFFFPTKENIPSDRPTSNQTCLRRVSITYGRGRRLVSGINPPDWYERQTAVSTLEFRSQTVSPLLQAIAPLLIDHLIKSRSAPNQASQISDFFFFFFPLSWNWPLIFLRSSSTLPTPQPFNLLIWTRLAHVS